MLGGDGCNLTSHESEFQTVFRKGVKKLSGSYPEFGSVCTWVVHRNEPQTVCMWTSTGFHPTRIRKDFGCWVMLAMLMDDFWANLKSGSGFRNTFRKAQARRISSGFFPKCFRTCGYPGVRNTSEYFPDKIWKGIRILVKTSPAFRIRSEMFSDVWISGCPESIRNTSESLPD